MRGVSTLGAAAVMLASLGWAQPIIIPQAQSNYGTQVGAVSGVYGGSAVMGNVVLTRLAAAPGGFMLDAGLWLSVPQPGRQFAVELRSGLCDGDAAPVTYVDPFTLSAPGLAVGTEDAAGTLHAAMTSSASLPAGSSLGLSALVTELNSGTIAACTDLQPQRTVNGYVTAINSTYFGLQELTGVPFMLPFMDSVELRRTELGTSVLTVEATRFRAGFPYLAQIHTAPCTAGSLTPVFNDPVTSTPVGDLFGNETDGERHTLRLDYAGVFGGGAMSLIVKDCVTADGSADFSGACDGGRPMMVCLDFLTAEQMPETASTTHGATTALPTPAQQEVDPCTIPDVQSEGRCLSWKDLGYCAETHRFFSFMMVECSTTCAGDCGESSAGQSTEAPQPTTTTPTQPETIGPTHILTTFAAATTRVVEGDKGDDEGQPRVPECPYIQITLAPNDVSPGKSGRTDVAQLETIGYECCLAASVPGVLAAWRMPSDGDQDTGGTSTTFSMLVIVGVAVVAVVVGVVAVVQRSEQRGARFARPRLSDDALDAYAVPSVARFPTLARFSPTRRIFRNRPAAAADDCNDVDSAANVISAIPMVERFEYARIETP